MSLSKFAGRINKVFAAALLVLASATSHAANPFVTDIYTADPTVRFFDGRYWVYTTHDERTAKSESAFDMRDWRAYSSTDLKTWTDHGVIMSLDDIAWANRDAWAVDVVEKDGVYYMYFPVERSKIGVAISHSPAGPFRDALGAPLLTNDMPNAPFLTIDPGVLIDSGGSVYLYFGNDDPIATLVEGGNPLKARMTPRVVKLKSNMLELDSEIMDVAGVDNFFEAPWIHKRGDLYYLSYAGNGIISDISYATADHPLGPFTKRGVVVDRLTRPSSVTNHHSIIDRGDRSYFFYHTTDLSRGKWFRRSVGVDRLSYAADGSIIKVQRTFMGTGDELHVDAGETGEGYTYQDANGNVWYSDRNFNDSNNIFTTGDVIADTLDDRIYQTQRYSEGLWWSQKPLTYFFKVENGQYEIRLLMAETYFTRNNKRVFHVDIEGERVERDLDIHAHVGHDKALSRSYVVTINDGEINLHFQPVRNNPQIAGIIIRRLQ